MKIAIMGAGALGGSFGFLLAEAGSDVTLVDVDQAKIDALRREGLTLVMPDGSRRHRPIKATTRPDEVGVVDLVQISVKGYHTSAAAELARPLVGSDTYVLSLQNGLKNLQRISAVLPDAKVVGGVTGYSAMPLGPTTIRFSPSAAGITLGRYDGSEDSGLEHVAATFAAAGLETHLAHGDIREPIWRKLLANVSVNAVAALTGLTGREIQEIEPAERLVRALAQETAAVARAQGFTFAELETADDWVIATLDWVGDNKVSMLQDMENGRRTEIDTLNLAVVERGEHYGVDTPLNWVIGLLVQIREQKVLRDRQAAGEASRPQLRVAGGGQSGV
ncbi:MAG: 2-dehydropantoate 2-reductase [Thermoleophilia bacterium]|nr:2-dehydropantoate 2-reductase [Thermoleophilia bacterium]